MSGDDLLNDNLNEEHEHEEEQLAVGTDETGVTDFGKPLTQRYIDFIKDFYPQNKTKTVQTTQQASLIDVVCIVNVVLDL